MSAAGGLSAGRGRLSLMAPEMPKLKGLPDMPGLATEGVAQQVEAVTAARQRRTNLQEAKRSEQRRVTAIKNPGSTARTRAPSLLGG